MAVSSLRKFADKLVFGFSSRLRNYERRCLEDALAPRGEGGLQVLAAQLESLERVQRFNSDRQVNLFFSANAPRFANEAADLTFAKVTYRSGENRLRVNVVAHCGRLSSLEFSGSPQQVEVSAATLVEVKTLADLGRGDAPAGAAGQTTASDLSALIAPGLRFEGVEGPASAEQLKSLCHDIGKLDDLERLLAVSNGWTCRGWRFNGTRLRDMPRAGTDELLRVVAENQTQMIGLGAVTSSRWVLYDGIDETATVFRGDLLELLRKVLEAA